MEKLLKKDVKFQWSEQCQEILDVLKMVTATILVFPDQKKAFHVHVDVLSVALGVVLAQPSKGSIDHLITFSSIKLSTTEKNYTSMQREGLAMVYGLQNFQ